MITLGWNLSFDGQCEAAFEFYEACLGGKINVMMTWGESPMAKDVPAEKINKLEQITKEIFKDMRSMSMVMGLGKSDESLFQNSAVIMKVADAQAHIKHYQEYLQAYSDFMKGINLPDGFPKPRGSP